ncbi:hypothetical protein BJY52DRAFT_1420204 [Lactarius psammicola]|nr:hypothetical protein BJY52DRAFT_1420204 [Lactarius psammicola]
MTSISAMAACGPSCFSQGEGPPSLPRRSVELTNWFPLEIHLRSFLSTNNVRAPIMVPTQAGNSKGPEPAHPNDHQGHPEEVTTLSTAIVPFAGRAVPTIVDPSLVPLHFRTSQYPSLSNSSSPPSLDQGDGLGPLLPSHSSESSHLPVGYPTMTRSDTTIGPRHLEYAATPDGFPIAPRNSIPRPEVHYDYQPMGHGDPIQEPTPPDGPPAAVTVSPGVAVYPPPFNQTPVACLVSCQPLSSSLVNSDGIPPVRIAYQKEGNGQTTSRQPGQTYGDTTSFSNTARPVRGVGVDQHPSRHQAESPLQGQAYGLDCLSPLQLQILLGTHV